MPAIYNKLMGGKELLENICTNWKHYYRAQKKDRRGLSFKKVF